MATLTLAGVACAQSIGTPPTASTQHSADADRVELEGVVRAEGNYFTVLRLEIADPRRGVFALAPWLPRAAARPSDGRDDGPSVQSDVIGHRVRIVGTVETGPLKGRGVVRHVRVLSAVILD